MHILNNYHHFGGRHWESGSIHNYYAYRNVIAPHTGAPYSEALFMGVSGGVVMGYFTFAYKGYDPHVALLTRNTFDPMNTALSRLGIVQEVMQTTSADKGLANLLNTLAEGVPAIVWADMWSLPYNAFAYDEGMWGMAPIVVYGYDQADDCVYIADRANVGLTVRTTELATARARVKKEKFCMMTLDQPDPAKLAAAVTAGIWDCINLYLEKPPKGAAKSWGIKGFQHWADLLTKPKQRQSWEKEFPAGPKMYAGLHTAYSHFDATGIRGDAERGLYATFLEEAATILNKPQLQQVAEMFRASSAAWRELAAVLLPDEVALFGETRQLLQQKDLLFRTQGNDALPEIHQINERLTAIRNRMETEFPLATEEVVAHREAIANQLLQIRDLEEEAVTTLRTIMAG